MRNILSFVLCCSIGSAFGEDSQVEQLDTIQRLDEVQISSYKTINGAGHRDQLQNGIIYAGKKNELLQLQQIDANKITNNARQIFSKVPGVFVWENESSGTQVNIATRGLSPNRSWEFNVRQNGYDVTPDVFGYPEAYYNPPMEAVKNIEVIRGGAALQFGPQFGGMINYVLHKGNAEKKIEAESQNSTGNNGLVSTFNAVGGTVKNLNYYGFYNFKHGNGWRNNNNFSVHNAHASLQYSINKKYSLGAEYTFSRYIIQQPGGLTDSLFQINAKQSLRERNWFNINWHVASLNFEGKLTNRLMIYWKNSAVIGQRNSIGFNKAITIRDTIQASTGKYGNRQIDRDHYNTFNSESRVVYNYSMLKQEQALNAGIRVSYAQTLRQQLGKGDQGTEYNLNLQQDSFPRELTFSTTNVALFAEHLFQFTNNFSVTPGIRYEFIQNTIEGRIDNKSDGPVLVSPDRKQYHVVLAGVGLQYTVAGSTNFYANATQTFRPVLYSDLTPSATTDVIDNNLKAASGVNVDFGYRGTCKDFITFDIAGYYLFYKNRIGNLLRYTDNDPAKPAYIFKSNLGNTRSAGFEGMIEVDLVKAFTAERKYGTLSIFTSLAFTDARYLSYTIYKSSGTAPNVEIEKINLKNNKVEYAPLHNHRAGLTYKIQGFSTTVLVSHTGSVFTDAENTVLPNAAATVGKLNAYTLLDWSFSYYFKKHYNIKGGINNLTNRKYATRRSGGYPGPGILPADGLTWFVSLGIKF
jgi:Fe(3+) dicitrate transport protein